MKGKYITTQILLACLSKPADEKKKDLIEPKEIESKETDAGDAELMQQWKLKIQSAHNNNKETGKQAA